MDELAKRFFHDPAAYARAVELLSRYEEVENLNWESVDDDVSGLDEGETALLETAISHRKAVQQNQKALLEKVALLEKTVEALSAASNPPEISKWKSLTASFDQTASLTTPATGKVDLPPASEWNTVAEDDLLVEEVGQKFVDYKRGLVTAGSLTSIQSKVDLFLKILSEHHANRPLRISDLSAPKLRTFLDTLLKVPSKRGGFPKDVSIKAMPRMNLPPIAGKTAKDTTLVIGEFLTLMEWEGYPITPGLKGILSSVKTPKKKDGKKRLDFSSDDLKHMFHWDSYNKGLFKRASEYWIPLIALFSGARRGEIAQLHCADIHEEQGVWMFDFNEDGEKQLKSETSNRLVPVHSTLLDLGLLDFIKQRRKSDKRLFPKE